MISFDEIDAKTKAFSEERDRLADMIQQLDDAVEKAKRAYMPHIKRIVRKLIERKEALKNAIEESPEHFQKPKTMTIHGTTIGFRKAKGKLEWEDDELVIKLIKKHLPESEWPFYIQTKEKPIKAGLETLEVKELKKLGVEASDSGEKVVIKSAETEIDKFVNKLLKEDEIEEAQEVAA